LPSASPPGRGDLAQREDIALWTGAGYERQNEPLPKAGQLSGVVDSVAQWRAGHEEFWPSAGVRVKGGDPDFTMDDDTLVLASASGW